MKSSPGPNFAEARANMVDGQLRPNRINNKALLGAFAVVPREIFVPPAQEGTAYVDAVQPLGGGREMLSPMVLAHLIQELELVEESRVLVACGGTGYSAALVGKLAHYVVMVEADKKFLTNAKNTLLDLGLTNVRVVQGEVGDGAPRHAPYDAILLDVAVGRVPPALMAQLKEGGRLATVRPGADGVLEACVLVKHGHAVFETALFETKGHVLPTTRVAESFVF